MVIAALAFLLFPSSPSVLCIAPGGHVALEYMNAGCCEGSAFSDRSNHSTNGFEEAGDCRNCTDLFVTLNASEAICDSTDHGALNSLTFETPWIHIRPIASPYACQLNLNTKAGMQDVISPSLPLRC